MSITETLAASRKSMMSSALCSWYLLWTICHTEAIPFEEVETGQNIILVATRGGGHSMEWFQGLTSSSWSVEIAMQFFNIL